VAIAVGVGLVDAEASNVGIVRAQDGRFVVNGAPFYFVGTNAHWMIPMTGHGLPAYADDQLALARTLGFTVLRAMGFADGPGMGAAALQPAPGVFNEAAFRAFDYVLHKADLSGVRLLIPLVNGNPAYGGVPQYLQWCGGGGERAFYERPACKALYKNYITRVLNRVNTYNGRRYKDDPTIFAWELANEPHIEHYGDRSGQVIRAWVAEIAAHIKAHDSNHMVATGEEGYDVTTAGYAPVSAYNNQTWLFDGNKGLAWTQNTADPNIDFGSIHLYPELWNLASHHGQLWIADHIRIARSLGKPLVVGEFGMRQNSAATFQAWLDTVEANDGAGSLMWQLMCSVCYGIRDQFGVKYPPASSVATVLAGAASRANARSVGGLPGGPPPGVGVFVAAGNLDGQGGPELIVGADNGGGPRVRSFRGDGAPRGTDFFAYDPAFAGGVRVAACDFDGDGRAEIVTAPGPGGSPHVRVLKLDAGGMPASEMASFLAYPAAFTGGVYVACGVVDSSGIPRVVTGAGQGGGPHVRVFRIAPSAPGGAIEIGSGFLAFDGTFRGGVRVAVCDTNRDGRGEVVVAAGPGGGPHVRVIPLSGSAPGADVASFFSYNPTFAGGVYVGCGPEGRLLTGAGHGGGPHVRVFRVGPGGAVAETAGFFAYAPTFGGGVRVAGGDGGALPAIVTGAGGGGPHVRAFQLSGGSSSTSFMAY
jgi:mannan endo-1,4-beta-mannosidase